MQWKEKQEQDRQKKKDELLERDMEDCTFKPAVIDANVSRIDSSFEKSNVHEKLYNVRSLLQLYSNSYPTTRCFLEFVFSQTEASRREAKDPRR